MKKPVIYIFFLFLFCIITIGCGAGAEDSEFSYSESTASEAAFPVKSINAYSSIEKAQNAIGFAFKTPTQIPTGYVQNEISVINDSGSQIAQINYESDDYYLTYRASLTTDDLNTDYNSYEKEKVLVLGEREVTCLCNQDIIFVATWQESGCNYCIMSDQGLDTTTISAMILSVK